MVHGDAASLVRSLELHSASLRELTAIVSRVPYLRVDANSAAIADYRARVEGIFATRAILPAPFGTVFKSRDALIRWMELHYVSLMDGLEYIDRRAGARLRIVARGDVSTPDYETTVFDSLRFLKRHAIASVSLPEDGDPRTTDVAFLVERERWSSFADAVREERERLPGVVIEQSGPWPAYDFVRLQFGG